MRVGDHRLRTELGSVGQRHTGGAAGLDEDVPDARPGPDVGAVLARVGRDRLRDRARAPSYEGPLGHLAVDLPDVVVEQDVGRTRRVGSAVRADSAGDAARRLHLRRFEPLLEELGDR